MIQFTVLGTPAPQGSGKIVGGRGRGRPRLISDNPRTMPWRQQVGWCALRARAEAGHSEVYAGRHVPVRVSIEFWFAKPDSVPKKRSEMCVKPDLDKLCRAVLDSLTGILFADDGVVVELTASKRYGLPQRAEIEVDIVAPKVAARA